MGVGEGIKTKEEKERKEVFVKREIVIELKRIWIWKRKKEDRK